MRNRTLATSTSIASRLFVLGVAFTTLTLAAAMIACGSTSGTVSGGGTPPPTVNLAATPNPANAGQQVTLTVSSSNATSCTWTAGLSGTAPMNGTATDKPAATTTYTVSCSGPGGNNSASVTVTVNAAPPTITSVTVTANPTTITTAQTSTCTATVQGTGNYSSSVTWTATNGTLSGSGSSVTLTPLGAGTSICTATSSQDATQSGSASVTVTQAAPTITGISPNVIYLDGDGFVGNVKVTGAYSSDVGTDYGDVGSRRSEATLDCLLQ